MIRIILFSIWTVAVYSQTHPWQQAVKYDIDIEVDDDLHRFSGSEKLVYFNNSPDTLRKSYFHLYYNAFQPGSMMDVRSRTLPDPDPRVGDRIAKLTEDEIGFLQIKQMTQDGIAVDFKEEGTILEVKLAQSIAPGDSITFQLNFEAQIPAQIRRTGRDNKENIAYSMSQWYPKICAYDEDGWHPNPYIAREFYGVFGDFNVHITMDASYIIAATGVLQNADEIGYGYSNEAIAHGQGDRLTWHFTAEDVHDFVWAADREYKHNTITTNDGVTLHFFYEPTESNSEAWEKLPQVMKAAYHLMVENYGPYPYPVYSFIQGGDGGMEYPMATLITGGRSIGSLASVSIHEMLHAWFQGLLATNESLYAWMDEGFTELAENHIKNELRKDSIIPGRYVEHPFLDLYDSYKKVVRMGVEEPLSTHSDHFMTNTAYGMASYQKGAVFLKQLEYIVGKQVFEKAMHRYYWEWRYHHPKGKDLLRIFEEESDMVLDWYYEYFIYTTKLIEYSVKEITKSDTATLITLQRQGSMPMPIDIELTYEDGSTSLHTVPLRVMRGAKMMDGALRPNVEKDWPWTNSEYTLSIPYSAGRVHTVRIDPSLRLADFQLENNKMEVSTN